MIRTLSNLAITITFLGIAGCTSSNSTTKPSEQGEEVTRANAAPVIVEVVSRDQRIVVRSGDTGATYSLLNSKGQTVVPAMDLIQLQAHHPELARRIGTMNASADNTVWAGVE